MQNSMGFRLSNKHDVQGAILPGRTISALFIAVYVDDYVSEELYETIDYQRTSTFNG
ncbi:hypothetical protein K449DRAFT_435108 [Hypoxylon sp. EC38]|nr:hypothetical protein K449DRAFT_435108 [Hypoxylon sp. EC38]